VSDGGESERKNASTTDHKAAAARKSQSQVIEIASGRVRSDVEEIAALRTAGTKKRRSKRGAVDIRTGGVAGRRLRVATTAGSPGSVPLLVFNGLGANLELLRGFAGEIGKFGIGIVVFDVPGTGGSSAPALPYRFSWLARLANTLLTRVGVEGPVDVAGVSWGGGLAQEFTHCYSRRVRRLLLAATTAGAVALPGRPSALLKMAGIRRHSDRDYLARISGELYGGKLRSDPRLLEQYGA
jgi:pimeloyl-ACP methyl ester carboxylesterase